MIQTYDIIMLIILIAATLWGVWKGMAWQIAALASVIVSAVVAVHASPAIAPLFSAWFGAKEPWNRYLAMLVLYVVMAAAIWIVFHLVSNVIDRIQLKEFDRQLGAIFGLVKGVLYCVVITFFAVTFSPTDGTSPIRLMVLQSRSGDWIARGIRNAKPILPEDIRTYLGKYIDELDTNLHTPPASAAPGTSEPIPGRGVAPAAPAPAPTPPPTAGSSGDSETKKSLKDRLFPGK